MPIAIQGPETVSDTTIATRAGQIAFDGSGQAETDNEGIAEVLEQIPGFLVTRIEDEKPKPAGKKGKPADTPPWGDPSDKGE